MGETKAREREREREKESDEEKKDLHEKNSETKKKTSGQKRRPQPQRRSSRPRGRGSPLRRGNVRLVLQPPQHHGGPSDPTPPNHQSCRRQPRRQRSLLRKPLCRDLVLDPFHPVPGNENVGEAGLLSRAGAQGTRRKSRDGPSGAGDARVDEPGVAEPGLARLEVGSGLFNQNLVGEGEEGRGAVVVAGDASLLSECFVFWW